MRTNIAAASPSIMRQVNLSVVFGAIRRVGPISRPQLARETGLSMPTVKQVVELLLAKGYVHETDAIADSKGPKRPGPRAKSLSFQATLGYVLGIDTGADNTVAKVADLSGRILATTRIAHPQPPHRDAVLATIRTTVEQVLASAGIPASDLLGVTVGTPGVVDPVTGSISLAPQIIGWDGIILAKELKDLADCPIVVESESHLSLLAEQWLGGARYHSNVVYIQLGIGIGGAILINGKIHRGNSGAAGEIAYLVIGDEEREESPESSAGAFEWFAGGQAYRRHGARAARTERGALLLALADGDPDAVTARQVFEAAAQADPAAVEITEKLLGRLGRGLANIATTLDPELILIGGGITNAGEALLLPIRSIINRLTPHPPLVALSVLGSDGSALGAIRRAMEIADENTFSFTSPIEQAQ
jgi:glucokinase